MSDSAIADLCRRIYREHRRAIDLILEHRPDQQQQIREFVEHLIGSTAGLILDDSSKASVRFAPSEWNVPALMSGSGWTKSGRVLLFEFQNSPDRLVLKLFAGPGPAEVRTRLYDLATSNRQVFVKARKSLTGTWTQLYAREFVSAKEFEADDVEAVYAAIKDRWEAFKGTDLPAILAKIAAEEWSASWSPP